MYLFINRLILAESFQVALKELNVPTVDEQRGIDRAWDIEASALKAINQLRHHHIMPCIAAIRRGESRYFMFPWADGGNLRDYWETTKWEPPNADRIVEMIVQMRGITDALDKLHNFGGRSNEKVVTDIRFRVDYSVSLEQSLEDGTDNSVQHDLHNEVDDHQGGENSESIRHGDLKPENILRFFTDNDTSTLGTLQVADMGLAKRHVVATENRGTGTSTRFGTRRYEAPETILGNSARSRLYDIWSLGCIILEFVVWALYGNNELSKLYDQMSDDGQRFCQYYAASGPTDIEVHPVVIRWIDHIQRCDPECRGQTESATQDLLKIVREKLLIVPLPPNRSSSTMSARLLVPPALGRDITRYRATAAEVCAAFDKILARVHESDYAFTGRERLNVTLPKSATGFDGIGNSLSLAAAELRLNAQQSALSPILSGILGRSLDSDYALPPLRAWEFIVDNEFAGKLQRLVGVAAFKPRILQVHDLCARCWSYDLLTSGFDDILVASELADSAATCQLCDMLYTVLEPDKVLGQKKIRILRDQSNMMLAGEPLPILSIIRDPEFNTPAPIQIGLPQLPEPETDLFFSIMRLWLEDCDSGHRCCDVTTSDPPTRLLEVGTPEEPRLRLVETKRSGGFDRYLALSHNWGDPKKYPLFLCTTMMNIESFLIGINEQELPLTFKDAVACTRRLGIPYLWIDSLCIVQGKGGDFSEQAGKMEGIFSGAYCVLAATRASSQHDGFLGRRPERKYITIERGTDKPLYVCEAIDNFNRDVIHSSFNQHGWRLQERALARRTIYFTEKQTYFECGIGVRCETLTRMRK
jgi:serine/threonine protein kinase